MRKKNNAGFTTKLFFFLVIAGIVSCTESNRFQGKYATLPDSIHIQRFDLDFIQQDTLNSTLALHQLAMKYPAFYPFFIQNILGLNIPDTVGNGRKIAAFLNHPTQKKVHQDMLKALSDLSTREKVLQKAISALCYYFPEKPIPDIYAMATGFNLQFATGEGVIAVGTDFYLGSDYPVYKDVTYDYLIKNFRIEQLESDVIQQLLYLWFPVDRTSMTLLDNMIYEGKIMFLKEIALGDCSEEMLIGYTKEENEWFKSHQKPVLSLMYEKKYLYSTEYKLINEMIQPAPFCSPVSQEAPGRLGIRLGWEIVRTYMKHNEDIGLLELMNNRKYQQIFEKSYYRP